jgi:NodT family efflux transporter outer membrane factor (OMF) lipoprotein
VKRIAPVLLLLPLVASCVKAPPRTQADLGVQAPEQWSTPQRNVTPPPDDWWTTFGDPELVRLIEIALEQNRDLQAAVARLDRARAEARIAGADLKPNVGLDVGAGLPDSITTSRYGASVVVGWEVDLWGRIRAGARAAVAEMQAVEADLRGARQAIAAEVARAWFAVIEAQQQVDLALRTADSFSLLTAQVRSRYEQGLRPALDLRLALSNQEAAEATLERRRRVLDALQRRLEILLGEYPSGRLLEEHPASEQPPLPPPVPAGLPAQVIERRPDLVAAERRLTASDQRWLAARKALYPRLSLTGSGGSATAALGDLLDGDFGVWSLAANLTQPLFQGGRLRANVDATAATSDEVLALYAATALRAYGEVETTLAAESYYVEQEYHLAQATEQLIAAERLSEFRYRTGVGDYLTVLESQTRSFATQTQLLTLRRQRLDNRVDLYLALGGGFSTDDNGSALVAESREDDES